MTHIHIFFLVSLNDCVTLCLCVCIQCWARSLSSLCANSFRDLIRFPNSFHCFDFNRVRFCRIISIYFGQDTCLSIFVVAESVVCVFVSFLFGIIILYWWMSSVKIWATLALWVIHTDDDTQTYINKEKKVLRSTKNFGQTHSHRKSPSSTESHGHFWFVNRHTDGFFSNSCKNMLLFLALCSSLQDNSMNYELAISDGVTQPSR